MKEEEIVNILKKLEDKIDSLSSQFKSQDNRLDGEIIAVLTAAAFNVFGRPVSLKSVRLVNDNSIKTNKRKNYNQFNVLVQN